jgi:hypothetical protein
MAKFNQVRTGENLKKMYVSSGYSLEAYLHFSLVSVGNEAPAHWSLEIFSTEIMMLLG